MTLLSINVSISHGNNGYPIVIQIHVLSIYFNLCFVPMIICLLGGSSHLLSRVSPLLTRVS